ncbi:unnamed protein product [Oreochromis niloticus]|nr:unnamed protein product [Mustela putorius furo]
MLPLLGTDEGGFLFTDVFVQQLPVRAGLANSPLLGTKDYRSLEEEVDHILLATRSSLIQAIIPDSPTPPPILLGASDSSMVAGIAARWHRGKGLCFYHQRDSTVLPLEF